MFMHTVSHYPMPMRDGEIGNGRETPRKYYEQLSDSDFYLYVQNVARFFDACGPPATERVRNRRRYRLQVMVFF